MRKPDDLERPKCFNLPIEYHGTKVFGFLGFGILDQEQKGPCFSGFLHLEYSLVKLPTIT